MVKLSFEERQRPLVSPVGLFVWHHRKTSSRVMKASSSRRSSGISHLVGAVRSTKKSTKAYVELLSVNVHYLKFGRQNANLARRSKRTSRDVIYIVGPTRAIK